VAGGLRERAVLAPAGHPPVDQPRIDRAAGVGAETQPFHRARAESFDQRIRLPDHREQVVDRARLLEVERERRTAARHHVEARIVRDHVRRAARVRRARPVDPQDVGAQIRQHHRPERRRADPDHLDHFQAV
jgi:hypothetical protein